MKEGVAAVEVPVEPTASDAKFERYALYCDGLDATSDQHLARELEPFLPDNPVVSRPLELADGCFVPSEEPGLGMFKWDHLRSLG